MRRPQLSAKRGRFAARYTLSMPLPKPRWLQRLPWLHRHFVAALLLHLLLAWGLYEAIRWLRAQAPAPPERPFVVIELVAPPDETP